MAYEHNVMFVAGGWSDQPDWWQQDFLRFRGLKIYGQDVRNKRAARKSKKGL